MKSDIVIQGLLLLHRDSIRRQNTLFMLSDLFGMEEIITNPKCFMEHIIKLWNWREIIIVERLDFPCFRQVYLDIQSLMLGKWRFALVRIF